MHRVMLALCGLALILVGDVLAQETFPTLNAGTTLRIHLADGSTHEGPLLSSGAGHLVLAANADRGLATSEIDALWVRRRATKEGATIGAIVAGGASLAFGAVLCGDLGGGEGCKDWGDVAVMGMAGAVTGGLIGAFVGGAFSRWDLRYSRESGTADFRHGGALTARVRTGPSSAGS